MQLVLTSERQIVRAVAARMDAVRGKQSDQPNRAVAMPHGHTIDAPCRCFCPRIDPDDDIRAQATAQSSDVGNEMRTGEIVGTRRHDGQLIGRCRDQGQDRSRCRSIACAYIARAGLLTGECCRQAEGSAVADDQACGHGRKLNVRSGRGKGVWGQGKEGLQRRAERKRSVIPNRFRGL